MNFKRIFLIALIAFHTLGLKVHADDELVIIQATSTSGKSFVIRNGAEQGVSRGQESLFSTKNASFAAVCTEVSRFFSMWTIKDKRGKIPFHKGDFVTYTNNIDAIWSELPKLQYVPKEELVFKETFQWLIRGNYSYGLSESVSDTTENKTANRIGYQFEVLYANRFAVNWEWAVGFRLDRENASLNEPVLDVPTNRYMVTGEFLYHFEKIPNSDNNMYAGVGMAYGITNTTISEQTSTGTAFVVPSLKVGYINRISPQYSLVFEGAVESLAQAESFEDSSEQTTNIVNSKFSIGVRF